MSWNKCPYCNSNPLVIEARPLTNAVKRRYQCRENKNHRFTTYEFLPKQPTHGRLSAEKTLKQLTNDRLEKQLKLLIEDLQAS